jgi:hypothetical protein
MVYFLKSHCISYPFFNYGKQDYVMEEWSDPWISEFESHLHFICMSEFIFSFVVDIDEKSLSVTDKDLMKLLAEQG